MGNTRFHVFGPCETPCSSNRLDMLERVSALNLRVPFSGLDALTCAGYLAYSFQNQEINSHAGNLNDTYLKHRLQRKTLIELSLARFFGTDILSSQHRTQPVFAQVRRDQLIAPRRVIFLEHRSRKCAVAPLMSQSRERDTTGTTVVKAQPNLNPKGSGGQQQG
jgi:hypothetical protein